MSSLVPSSSPVATKSATDLSTLLTLMLQYGHPALYHLQSGWHCSCEFFCHGKGVEFKVRSDFGHQTPEIAAHTCLERMYDSLNQIGVKLP